jgi:hypothetical protein
MQSNDDTRSDSSAKNAFCPGIDTCSGINGLFQNKSCSGITYLFRNKASIPKKVVIPERPSYSGKKSCSGMSLIYPDEIYT